MHTALLAVTVALTSLLTFVTPVERVAVEGPRPGTWAIDPARSVVQFTVTKLGYEDVTGRFLDFSGVVRYDKADPSNSSVEWRVRVESVKTDARNRDESLRQADYFGTSRHPEMTFRSERVRSLGDGRLQVEGPITIKGVSRAVSAIAEPVGGGFETRFELNRYDFGINGGRVMGRLIGRTVRVRLVAVATEEDS